MPSVLKKADKLNLSLSLLDGGCAMINIPSGRLGV